MDTHNITYMPTSILHSYYYLYISQYKVFFFKQKCKQTIFIAKLKHKNSYMSRLQLNRTRTHEPWMDVTSSRTPASEDKNNSVS